MPLTEEITGEEPMECIGMIGDDPCGGQVLEIDGQLKCDRCECEYHDVPLASE